MTDKSLDKPTAKSNLNVIMLHADMVNKQNDLVTTSLTMIDIHDVARSSRTYGVRKTYIAHPSPALRKLGRSLKTHWQDGHGATYNPNRKEAVDIIDIVSDLDEAIHRIDMETGKLPKLIATSAKAGDRRVTFQDMRELLKTDEQYMLMLGTGWGMCDELLERSNYFLEPINGPTDYNHLSVRSACAIMLDRLLS